MDKNRNSFLDDYLDRVKQEFNKLPEQIWKEYPLLYELREIMTPLFVDSRIFGINQHLFQRFIFLLEGYNQVGNDVIEDLLQTANALRGMLKAYSSESDSILTKNDSPNITLEKRIRSLEKGLSAIEIQQKEIFNLNESVIYSQNQANRIINELKDKNEAYSQLIDEDSNVRVLKLYTDIYDREILIADRYINWTLIIFILIAVLLVWKFFNISLNFDNWGIKFEIPSKKFIWESVLNTLILLGLSTPAWYLAKESSKHRKVAYKAQMLGTELASFPLYAREFKDEERLELRKHLADRFFGQELYNDSKVSLNSDNSLEQIKLLTEANKVLAESLKIKKSVESS